MSQDVLEALVEGPEEDAVYELYAEDEDEEMLEQGEDEAEGSKGKAKEKEDTGVDMEVYDAIVVEDDSD